VRFDASPYGPYLLYSDCFKSHVYTVSRSSDLEHFTPIPGSTCASTGSLIYMPPDARHGSFTPITRDELLTLLLAYPTVPPEGSYHASWWCWRGTCAELSAVWWCSATAVLLLGVGMLVFKGERLFRNGAERTVKP